MDPNRKTAIILGILFITAIVTGIILDNPDYPANGSENEHHVFIGTTIEIMLAVAIVVMPILMYPILKKHSISIALGFVGAPLATRYWGYGVLAPIIFSLGSLIFYYLLYKSKLIPRWLSGWGIIGATMFLASAFLPLFGYGRSSTIFLLLHTPGGVNHIVLAVWLIVKGLNPSAIASPAANTE